MRFWHYFRVLRARRALVAGVVVFATLVAFVIMYVYPVYPSSKYESVARLMVTPPGYEATQLSSEPRPWNYGVNQDEIFTTTIGEMLKSQSVLDMAAEDLPEGEDRAIARSLEVDPIKAPKQGVELLTHIIEVRTRALSAEQAQKNTDALLESFIAFHRQVALEQAEEQRDLIASEMEAAKERSASARAALETYKSEHGFIDLDRNAATLANRYLELQNDLIASETGLSDLGSRGEAAVTRAMDETMALIRELPAQEAALAELTIEADVADSTYRTLNAKLLEANVTLSINTAAGKVDIMDSASLPELPVSYYEPHGPLAFIPPFDYRKAVILLAVLLLSAALASAWILVGDALDDRIRSAHHAVRFTGLPLLGDVVGPARSGDVAGVRKNGAYRQSYNRIAARVVNHLAGGGKPVMAVVGAKTQEGRTTVVSELGQALAVAGLRVAMVDADLRARELSERFGGVRERGLEAAVFGSDPAADTLVATDYDGLFLVPAGPEGKSPLTVFNSPRFGEYLQRLAAEVDVVLIDTPPAAAFADANFIVRAADTSIFVMRAGTPPAWPVYEDTLEQLKQVNAECLGVILVGVEPAYSEGAYHFARYQRRLDAPLKEN